VYLSKSLDGDRFLDARLDPIGGSIVETELARLERQEFEADWAEARERYGDGATVQHLARTPAQRRADALVRMAERSASLPEGAKLARSTVNIHIDLVTFVCEVARAVATGDIPRREVSLAGIDPGTIRDIVDNPVGAGNRPGPRMCELEDGTPVLPSEAVALAVRGDVRRVVFGSKGHVLDFGRKTRFPPGGLREAIIARDRTCTVDGCERPGRACQVDHHQPWGADGDTAEWNLRLMCGPHNRGRHRRSRPTGDDPGG
jgi:hypothetical protein